MSTRADALAKRVRHGASALIAFVETLSEEEWQMICFKDGPTVGVIVHHVAVAYPFQINMVNQLASGQAIRDISWELVDQYNAQHAHENANVKKAETLDLLQRNSDDAVCAIQALSDEQLDRVSPISFYGDVPLTTQFYIEDNPIKHSHHHLTDIRAAIGADSN